MAHTSLSIRNLGHCQLISPAERTGPGRWVARGQVRRRLRRRGWWCSPAVRGAGAAGEGRHPHRRLHQPGVTAVVPGGESPELIRPPGSGPAGRPGRDALAVLYEIEITGDEGPEILERRRVSLSDYVVDMVTGVGESQDRIDEALARHLRGLGPGPLGRGGPDPGPDGGMGADGAPRRASRSGDVGASRVGHPILQR